MATNSESPVAPEVIPGESISRREAIFGGAGSKVIGALGLGAIPFALAAMARKSDAQTSTDLSDALGLLLTIEYMQVDLHSKALSASGFVPSAVFQVFVNIRSHDLDHVTTISNLISSAGGTAPNSPTFDWTAKGAFPGFNFSTGQYATYAIIAQGLTDLAVRAYKGQAARMGFNTNIMTQVLTIHSVEGRHAGEIRHVRGNKFWITGASRDDLPAFFQPVYDGEDATVHAGYDSSALAAADGGSAAVTQAFDEPMTKAQVTSVIQPFM